MLPAAMASPPRGKLAHGAGSVPDWSVCVLYVKYEGRFASVSVPVVGETVTRGDHVRVDKELGASLISQGWARVKPAEREKKSGGNENTEGDDS